MREPNIAKGYCLLYRQRSCIRSDFVAILVLDNTSVLETVAVGGSRDNEGVSLVAFSGGIGPAATAYFVLPLIAQAFSAGGNGELGFVAVRFSLILGLSGDRQAGNCKGTGVGGELVAILIGNNAPILVTVTICCGGDGQAGGIVASGGRIGPTAAWRLVLPLVGDSVTGGGNGELDGVTVAAGLVGRLGGDLQAGNRQCRGVGSELVARMLMSRHATSPFVCGAFETLIFRLCLMGFSSFWRSYRCCPPSHSREEKQKRTFLQKHASIFVGQKVVY